MATLPFAEVNARLSAVLDEVVASNERIVITRNGRPEAVLLSVADLTALEETLDLNARPGLREQLDAAAAEIDRGDWVGEHELGYRYPHPR